MKSLQEQLSNAMLAVGIQPPSSFIIDGEIHKFSTNGKSTDTAGRYCIHNTEIPYGFFQDWRTGICHPFRLNLDRPYTKQENDTHKQQLEAIQKLKDAKQQIAANEAVRLWNAAAMARIDHPYLVKKGIKAHGVREHKGALLIPLREDKKLFSLQYIWPEDKTFLTGSRIAGCYFGIGKPIDILCVAEGYATGASIYEATGYSVAIAFYCANLLSVAKYLRSKFPSIKIIICGDDDFATKGNPGLTKAKEAANVVNGAVAIPIFADRRPSSATDFNDMATLCGLQSVSDVINKAIDNFKNTASAKYPKPLPEGLPPVMPFDPDMLPQAIRDHVMDLADRQQSPPDFAAVVAICAAAAVVGSKVSIRPKQFDTWIVFLTQWGAIVGRPSAMKSPSLKEALKPIDLIEDDARNKYHAEINRHAIDSAYGDLLKLEFKAKAKNLIKEDKKEDALHELEKISCIDPKPLRSRIRINDATVEKLGELLNENPNGLMLVRDELSGWLSNLAKEEYQGDRAFYLECFDGNGRFTYDRIGRGTIEIMNCTLSVIGCIQPSKIRSIVRDAIRGTADDGLIQRLQLTVYPDDIGSWKWKDRAPNSTALTNYNNVYSTLHNLTTGDGGECPNILQFTTQAQQLYIDWMEELQAMARADDIHPVLESHILKLPKTIAGLALLFELVDGGRQAVGVKATAMALDWAEYLITHAKRLYSIATNQSISNARLILSRRNKLNIPFSVREVQRKCWTGLDCIGDVTDAIQCLIDHNYVFAESTTVNDAGGRPTIQYFWNTINDKDD